MNVTFNHLITDLLTFPAMGLLFLSNYPKSKPRSERGLYLFFWLVGAGIIELVMSMLGYYKYSNGWNVWWSTAFDLVFLPMMIIHQKYPPMAWVIALILGTTIFLSFQIPISQMK
ncbi:hypothetical protein DEAC_c18180 [Desulfosporosinus acididurans]|uniref:Uncharacterized protein n=2 Tax=Desulfosporosinus acididurans TaxID=476652 RepID=A0A0J1FSG4_9FIRM|nr:hypothetical protein DEAC_c18180 [Desulfosporosinus acididurans]